MTRLRTALALTLAVPLLALGACSGQDDPDRRSRPGELVAHGSASASESSAVTEPAMPKPASK